MHGTHVLLAGLHGWTHEHLLVVLPTTNFTTKVVGAQTTATAYLPIHDISQSRPQEDLDLAVIPVSRQWSHNRTVTVKVVAASHS